MSVPLHWFRNGLRAQAALTLCAAVGLAALPGLAGTLLWHARWDPGFHAGNPSVSLRIVALLSVGWSGLAWGVSNKPALNLRHAAVLVGPALAGGVLACLLAPGAGTHAGIARLVWIDTALIAGLAVLLWLGKNAPNASLAKPSRQRPHPLRWISVALGIGGVALVVRLAMADRARLQERSTAGTDEDHFKYGSVAAGPGFPLDLWRVLPEVFKDRLPGGWAQLGLQFEPGHETPVGWSRQTLGYEGLMPNCALCHCSSFRTAADAPRQLIPAGPANQLHFDALMNFLFDCAADPRFTAKELIPAIERHRPLGVQDQVLLRTLLIPGVRDALNWARADFQWQESHTGGGHGRADAFNLFKFNIARLPVDGTTGVSDYPPLWNQRMREGRAMHWNGSGTEVASENLLSAFVVILFPPNFAEDSFTRMSRYIADLPPPRFPGPIDAALADKGATIYRDQCARCHAPEGSLNGKVTPLPEIGTDDAFHRMWTPAFATYIGKIDQPPFVFPKARVTSGYANVLLDGCWARAPYLHNGSVPSLWDLLQPPANRPGKFYRGYDVYDARRVGFVSQGPEAERSGALLDTSLTANGNGGHTFGTELPEADKWALIEFLKTL